ncbi:uncharacterized protein LOC130985446 [Salvia miltiorrhiza]|uniref:uncharacterized protein LOC130985446 n=1 Tax=Salvia miltiorrhiza TaxID=226208 RepID=UPI0025AD238E|nr:uncharacterized protein LOC130985446 [Salvia miltiorrhiza]
MQILQRCRNLLILNNTVTQSTRLAAAAPHLASLHSSGVTRDEEPSKTYIRYTVRQKRPDTTKKALKDILYNGGCSTSRHEGAAGYADRLNKKSRIKAAHHSKRAAQRKLKRKHQRENPLDDCDDDPAKAFFAAFGRVGSNWNFRRWEQRSEWAENYHGSNSRLNEQGARSMTYADRKVLGLPETGPLKIEDVKTAFRSSALKWHPDRHQPSARAAAQEQFKHCVDAYKSLCASVSSRKI